MGSLYIKFQESKTRIRDWTTYLYMTIPELIDERNKLMTDNIRGFEEGAGKPELLSLRIRAHATTTMEFFPDSVMIYITDIERLEAVCRILRFKIDCLHMWEKQNGRDPEKLDLIRSVILDAIKKNSEITYEELVHEDMSLDIELELENLIDTGRIKGLPPKRAKYTTKRWQIR